MAQITNIKNAIDSRSLVLDCGRSVALICVMLFHFYSSWADKSKYPYGDKYDFFSWGHCGVKFFFILSAFFVLGSLSKHNKKTNKNVSPKSCFLFFWKKKIVRLGIPLIFCSLITWLTMVLWDTTNIFPSSHYVKNLIVSCLFIKPDVLNLIFGTSLTYINGSYWFLWVEIQFLLIVSLIYFFGTHEFHKSFWVISNCWFVCAYCFRRVVENYFLTNKLGLPFSYETMTVCHDWMWAINYPMYAQYFLFGIGCHLISINQHKKAFVYIISALLQLLLFKEIKSLYVIAILLFWLCYSFCYSAELPNSIIQVIKPFAKFGEASYTTYLIHEFIGVLYINKLSLFFGEYQWLCPVLLIGVFFMFGLFSFHFIEKPLSRLLLR